ncbi:MAG: hypothetical protein U9R58_15640 [Chloroflexota bacterium]|nr:hypothetical protein [Chloroflexota bacterium]
MRVQVRKDFLFVNTSYYTISDDEHYIEFDWIAANSPGANDGELTLYIDGVQKEQLTGIDNVASLTAVLEKTSKTAQLYDIKYYEMVFFDKSMLGAVTEIDNGTRGTLILHMLRTGLDAFESRSDGYIGQVAALPGFPVAQVSPVDVRLMRLGCCTHWLLEIPEAG